jgi:hypothetical protein
VIQRGKASRSPARRTGTQKFFVRGGRGWDSYTWRTKRRGARRQTEPISVTVDVGMAPRPKGRGRKKGPLVDACYRLPHMDPDAVRQLYRKRFGIETGYR